MALRHLFASKFLPLVGKLSIEELDIAFIHASTYHIGPPKEDSTYGMLGGRVVHCFSQQQYLKKVVQPYNLMPLIFLNYKQIAKIDRFIWRY